MRETTGTPEPYTMNGRAAAPPRNACQEEGSGMDFKDLSPELREKAKECTSPEELLALAKHEGYKLSEEELGAISGGRWTCDTYCTSYDSVAGAVG